MVRLPRGVGVGVATVACPGAQEPTVGLAKVGVTGEAVGFRAAGGLAIGAVVPKVGLDSKAFTDG